MAEDNVRIFQLHGREYQIHKLPATKGVALWTRLVRLFGDPLVRVVVTSTVLTQSTTKTNGEAKLKQTSPQQATPEQLNALVSNFLVFEKLKDDDILELMHIVFPYVVLNNAQIYKGNDQDIDTRFNGYELDLFPVFLEALRFNLGPFFEGALKRFANVSIPTVTELNQ